MYPSIEFKLYVLIISCVCNLLHALQFNSRNGNKHPILSSVYEVINLNQISNKETNSRENRGPSLVKQMIKHPNPNPNNRRYSIEDYEYEDPYDYLASETKHK